MQMNLRSVTHVIHVHVIPTMSNLPIKYANMHQNMMKAESIRNKKIFSL